MKTPIRIASMLVGLTFFTLALTAEPRPVLVISPPNNAVLPSGPFYVIAKGEPADLKIDGRQQPWDSLGGSVHAARLTLKPGRHEIRIGKQIVAVSVRDGTTSSAGEVTHLHPVNDKAGCAACHPSDGKGGQMVVGPTASFAACLTCHQPAQFEVKHAHPLEPLKHCGACHAPHGAPLRGLLKEPAKKLCAACHDA